MILRAASIGVGPKAGCVLPLVSVNLGCDWLGHALIVLQHPLAPDPQPTCPMMMGPAPRIMIVFRSVRLGTRCTAVSHAVNSFEGGFSGAAIACTPRCTLLRRVTTLPEARLVKLQPTRGRRNVPSKACPGLLEPSRGVCDAIVGMPHCLIDCTPPWAAAGRASSVKTKAAARDMQARVDRLMPVFLADRCIQTS